VLGVVAGILATLVPVLFYGVRDAFRRLHLRPELKPAVGGLLWGCGVGMAAVFAGAAHVPIASLMMVTEMTGGYTLLVPAALAVMVSYLVQRRLAHGVKW